MGKGGKRGVGCLELQRGQVVINSKIKRTITNRKLREEQKRVLQMTRAMWKYNYITHGDIIEKFRMRTLYIIK